MTENANLIGAYKLTYVERWKNFDALKVICSFLIVCIHAPFPGEMGQYFTALSRIAVPIFFMITGFFYHNTIKNNKVKSQIKKIAVLVLWTNLLFFLWSILKTILTGADIINYLKTTVTIKALLKFIFLNETPFGAHLWYLSAILYVLIIVAVFDKIKGRKILYIISPLLLIGDLLLGKYSLLLFGREFPYIIVRNFLFVGIPYFLLGTLIFKNREKLVAVLKNKKVIMLFLIMLFSITTFLEHYFLVSNDVNSTRDHYISTTFLAVAVFLFFMVSEGQFRILGNKISQIGKNYSMLIYIFHPIFITILLKIVERLGLTNEYMIIQPIIVFFVTLAAVALYKKVVKAISGRLGIMRKKH
ncbi:MAG: acyltransferase family protein [Acutalibacteraceae bacterium]